jgi:hypothetical protein
VNIAGVRGSARTEFGEDVRKDPGKAAPVECFEIPVAEGNTKGTSGDAHGGGDGQAVVGSEDDRLIVAEEAAATKARVK